MRTRIHLIERRLLTAPRRVFGLAPPFILTRDRGFSPTAAAIEPRYRKRAFAPVRLQPALTIETPLERDPWMGAGCAQYEAAAQGGDKFAPAFVTDGERISLSRTGHVPATSAARACPSYADAYIT